MIAIWSSCSKELSNSLQVIQNRAARAITRNDWTISPQENLKQIGWMSINQLAHYHSMLMLHQVKSTGKPESIYDMYNWDYSHQTRQATSQQLKPKGVPRNEISRSSFRWRAAKQYNSLPSNITETKELKAFKTEIKRWILNQIPYKR